MLNLGTTGPEIGEIRNVGGEMGKKDMYDPALAQTYSLIFSCSTVLEGNWVFPGAFK